jgi:hypothetical protein
MLNFTNCCVCWHWLPRVSIPEDGLYFIYSYIIIIFWGLMVVVIVDYRVDVESIVWELVGGRGS